MTGKPRFQISNFKGGAGDSTRAAQSLTCHLLEENRLSCLPTIARRGSECAVCSDGKLDPHNEFQQSTKICGDCLGRFAQVGAALDAHAVEKTRTAKLEQWARGKK